MDRVALVHRLVTFGVSCLIHVALVGAAIAIGRDLVPPRLPSVLIADLTLIETPRVVDAPEPVAKPARPKPRSLTLPKPIATPPSPPVAQPEPAEPNVVEPSAIEPVKPELAESHEPRPSPVAPEPPRSTREFEARPGPTASFEAQSDVPTLPGPNVAHRVGPGTTDPKLPPATAMAIPPDGITQTAIPRGGYQVRPSYPSSARRLGIQGMTTLRIYVAADGRVTEVMIQGSAGHPDLDTAAAEAVKRWRFEPARRGSEDVGMWVLLPVEFRLR
jgi:periplasmic protein TonB